MPYLFCIVWVVAHWVLGMEVIHTPDSWGYIHFNATRSAAS